MLLVSFRTVGEAVEQVGGLSATVNRREGHLPLNYFKKNWIDMLKH